MSKCLVLFVEGDTEVEFYKQVVANARKLHPAGRFDTLTLMSLAKIVVENINRLIAQITFFITVRI